METWYTWIQMPNGMSVKVTCQAASCGQAKAIFEATYAGGAKILHLPSPGNG